MSSILVIDGHPNPESLTAALAQSYAGAAAGARLIALRDLDFDVHIRFGYTARMDLEPDLAEAREAVHAAKHLVIFTPVWWRSMPPLLKGFFDRAFLPKQEYRYRSNGLPEGLLKGRSARAIITSDTPKFLQGLMPDTKLKSLTRGTLGFCGFKPVKATYLAPVKGSTPQQRATWIEMAAALGRQDAAQMPANQRGALSTTAG